MNMYIYTYMYMYVCMYIHIHIHVYIYIVYIGIFQRYSTGYLHVSTECRHILCHSIYSNILM